MDWKAIFGSRIFKLIAAGSVTAGTLIAQPYRPVVFVGNSMQPTYADREMAIAITKFDDLHRGDVVVVEGADGPIIKRIAYLPGDEIKYVFFNGEWSMRTAQAIKRFRHPERFQVRTDVVPYGYIYVLGDNSPVSVDSRQFGAVPISSIRAILPNARPKAEWNSAR